MSHEYIHVGNGALYCKPCEVMVTEHDGAAAVRDMKEHEARLFEDHKILPPRRGLPTVEWARKRPSHPVYIPEHMRHLVNEADPVEGTA